jgi:hypothetical protein
MDTFGALEVATGKVTDRCYERHTDTEFLAFLKLVAKNYPRRELHVVCRQLRHAQASQRPGVAGQEFPGDTALHPRGPTLPTP